MRAKWTFQWILGLVAGMGLCQEWALAEGILPAIQEVGSSSESAFPTETTEAEETSGADSEPSGDNGGSGDEQPVAPEEEEGGEEKDAPRSRVPERIRQGADLRGAFQNTGSSRFGMNGRVLKLQPPAVRPKSGDDWRWGLELGLSSSKGNSDTLRYEGTLGVDKETQSDYYRLQTGWRYGESVDVKDAENGTMEALYQHRLSERVYDGVELNVYHDQMASLNYRARSSIALGRHFVRTDRVVLSAEAGPGYVIEKKREEKEGFIAGRVAQRLEVLITPTLQVWQTVEYIPNLGDSAVFFINGEAGLETALWANLSLLFTVEDRYDSQPAEDKKRNDWTTATSLKVRF